MPHLLIAGKIHDAGLAMLKDTKGITYDYVTEISHDSYATLVHKADGLVVRTQPVPAMTIAKATNLKIVSRHGVGYDAVDVSALNERKIPLAIVGDVNSRPVAEHAMMLILALAKKARSYDNATREGAWSLRNRFDSFELHEKTLLIIGFGRIGRHVATMASGFGMTILAHDPGLTPEAIRAAGAVPIASLMEGLALADIITLHAPKVGDRPLISQPQLAAMKSSAIIVNTARGTLIDEVALTEALVTGQLAGAGLDVFSEEPPPMDHPLFNCENVIVTPHTASLTGEAAVRMAVMSVKNVLDYFEGRLDPSLVVNRDIIQFGL
jgi:D-3-phosphoglycerate dehydrogenase